MVNIKTKRLLILCTLIAASAPICSFAAESQADGREAFCKQMILLQTELEQVNAQMQNETFDYAKTWQRGLIFMLSELMNRARIYGKYNDDDYIRCEQTCFEVLQKLTDKIDQLEASSSHSTSSVSTAEECGHIYTNWFSEAKAAESAGDIKLATEKYQSIVDDARERNISALDVISEAQHALERLSPSLLGLAVSSLSNFKFW